MVLPFEPQSIAFDNVKYSVDMPQVLDKSDSRSRSQPLGRKIVIFMEKFDYLCSSLFEINAGNEESRGG